MKGFPHRKSFEAWLKSLPPKCAIAERWHASDCPLCQWLIAGDYTSKPYISPSLQERESGSPPCSFDGVWRDNEVETGAMRLPRWADDFSRGIDRLARVKPLARGEHFYRAVTPDDCLQVLAEIAHEAKERAA